MKQPAISSLFHSQKHYDDSKKSEFTLPDNNTKFSQDPKSKQSKADLKGNASKGAAIELKLVETAASTKKEKNARHKSKSARKSIKNRSEAEEKKDTTPKQTKN